jgi:serine kinase of HPr protein (carbohydrate metabolism regulator)
MTVNMVHATWVGFAPPNGPAGAGTERFFGVLLRGPSGAGKSDLALRLIDRGWRLVADDQTELTPVGKALFAAAPAPIAGRMEVRGLGVVALPSASRAEICLVADLVEATAVERLPEPSYCELMGTRLRCLALDPFALSAVAKLRLAALREAGVIMDATRPGEGQG